MIGIIIGAASLVATLAISDRMMDFARGELEERTGVQVITVGSRMVDYRDGRWVPITDYPAFTMEDLGSARRSRRVVGVLARDRFEDLDNPTFAAYSPIRSVGILLDSPPGGRFTRTLQFKVPSVEAVLALRNPTIDWLASR